MSEKEFLAQVKMNQGIVFKLVSLYAADEEEKKDLYQEILLQAWKSFSSFRRESKFSTWLYRVSLNTILTQKRKVSMIEYKESIDELPENLQSETVIVPDFNSVKEAIRRLPEIDRAIISMHLDGYENIEIAATIGISNNHVAVKLYRIKQQLSKFLITER
ncbi:MAG: RNA polymerase sigma factor [Chitinophagaceae bacterium]|nr:RNA polymerase sigma factor [Chitinophagaceae bacterium]